MRVLVVTSEWPSEEYPSSGIFVQRQVSAFASLGVETRVFAFRGWASIVQYLRAFRHLRHRLAREEYDLIHAHFGQAGLLACLATRLPVVVTFHGSDVFGLGRKSGEGLKSALLRAVSRLAAHLASSVIAVSPEVKRELRRDDASVIPMGIDRRLFRPLGRDDARAQLGWPPGERTVLFIGGTNNPIKRFALARDAATRAAGAVSFPVSLRVCDNVAPETVPLFLNAADVLLITSRHEGGPVRLREALACNLPVVSVDAGDARLRLAKVAGCILAASDRPEAIAAALVEVLKDGRRVDGAVGIPDLDEQAIARKLVAVYEGVCARRIGAKSLRAKASANS
jgi:glycosyltransferase involved in cell wall biosynthesis